MSLNPLTWLDWARSIDRLWGIEKKHGALLEAHASEIQTLKDRLTRLEEHVKAREDVLIAEAKGAAAAVGSASASQHVSDISRRLGVVEERLRSGGSPLALPRP